MKKKILLLEDDSRMLNLMSDVLESSGYTALKFENLAAANAYLRTDVPDMAILDISLPDGNGLDLAEAMRDSADTRKLPIIALTGHDGLNSKKSAFSLGVDQYLVKPLDMDELVLWVQSLFRRLELDAAPQGGLLRAGDMEVDTETLQVDFRGRPVAGLTNREFELLACLVEHAPKVVSREYIMRQVWRTYAVGNLVDTQLYNLRRKLPEAAAINIQSVHGKGFRYFEE